MGQATLKMTFSVHHLARLDQAPLRELLPMVPRRSVQDGVYS